MFDAHVEAAQGVIVGTFIFRQRPCFGFLVGTFDARMVVLEPLVAAVGVDVGVPRQGWPASLEFEIMDPAGRELGNGDAAWPFNRLFRAVDDQGLGFALPPLNHTRVNKDSPDFCNRSNT